jgi:hypothetical protein
MRKRERPGENVDINIDKRTRFNEVEVSKFLP